MVAAMTAAANGHANGHGGTLFPEDGPAAPAVAGAAIEAAAADDDMPAPTPSERRQMFIEGAKEFDRRFPHPSAEEQVDQALAKGVISLAIDERPQCEQCEDFDWVKDDSIVLREQRSVALYLNRARGLVLRSERAWDEEADGFVVIQREHIERFINQVIRVAREAGITIGGAT